MENLESEKEAKGEELEMIDKKGRKQKLTGKKRRREVERTNGCETQGRAWQGRVGRR